MVPQIVIVSMFQNFKAKNSDFSNKLRSFGVLFLKKESCH